PLENPRVDLIGADRAILLLICPDDFVHAGNLNEKTVVPSSQVRVLGAFRAHLSFGNRRAACLKPQRRRKPKRLGTLRGYSIVPIPSGVGHFALRAARVLDGLPKTEMRPSIHRR